jgi:hypothetical protein
MNAVIAAMNQAAYRGWSVEEQHLVAVLARYFRGY